MREATKEEKESVSKYVKSISVDTGINFYTIQQGNEYMTHEEKQRCIELRYKESRTPEEEKEFNKLLAKWAKSFLNK